MPRAGVLMMRKMLASDNGISTSYFQLYDMGGGKVAVTLNNFCKLQDMGADDEDDILSCVHFLLVDVLEARTSKSRPGLGIVKFKCTARNAADQALCEMTSPILIKQREGAV